MTDLPQLSTKQSTKFYLLVLFGDYIRPRGGSVWMSKLLYLLDLLEVGEHTGRSTINRMQREGWFTVEKDGRQSRFSLTPTGTKLLNSGDLRLNDQINGQTKEQWDGRWHIVTYSLPEEKRKVRNDLRKQLAWLGYGPLGPGLWISPHNRLLELKETLQTLEIGDLVHIFSSEYLGPAEPSTLINQAWNLEEISADYVVFNEILKHNMANFNSQSNPSAADAFRHHFHLTTQLFPILQKDPNLPLDMLPPDWAGTVGQKLFRQFRNQLTPIVNPFIDQVLADKA